MQKKTANKYARTVDVIFLGLLLHTSLAQLVPLLNSILCKAVLFFGIAKESVVYSNFSNVADIILYAVIFLLPAFFIFKIDPNTETKITFAPRLNKQFIFLLIMTLGLVAVSAELTNRLTELFGYIGIGFKNYSTIVPDDLFGIILLFVSSGIVPAIVEEILFRKAILERLIPYGKEFAVFVSAAAFSLMHTNPTQSLYTFTAGLLLGIITVKSGSVVPAVFIHSVNNTLSVIYLLIEKYASEKALNITVFSVDTLLKLLGIVIFIVMVKKGFFNIDTEKNTYDFSPVKNMFRLFCIAYIFYTVYLSMRWVYLI